MKNILVFTFTLLSILYASSSLAAGWITDATIEQMRYSQGADVVHITYSGGNDQSTSDSCDNSNSFVMQYGSASPERGKMMLSGASMAFAAGKKVDIYILGCKGGIGSVSYPKVHYLYVKK